MNRRRARQGRSSVRTQRPANVRPGQAVAERDNRAARVSAYARTFRCSKTEAEDMVGD